MSQVIQCTGYNPRSPAVSCALPPQAEKSAGSERPWGEGVEIDFVQKLPPRPRTPSEVEQTYGRPAFRAEQSVKAHPKQEPHGPAPARQPGGVKGADDAAEQPRAATAASKKMTSAITDSETSQLNANANPNADPKPNATDTTITKRTTAAAPAEPAGKDALPVQVSRVDGRLTYYAAARSPFLGLGPRVSMTTKPDGSAPTASLILAMHSSEPGVGAGITVPMASIKLGACKSKVSMNGMFQMSAVIANLSFSPDCLSLSTSWEQADVANFKPRGWVGAVYSFNPREVPAWLAELPGVSTVLEKLNGAAGVKSSRAQ